MKIGDKDEHDIEYSCPYINVLQKRLRFANKVIERCLEDIEKIRKINETLRNNQEIDKNDENILSTAKHHFGNRHTADYIDDCVSDKEKLEKKVDELEHNIEKLEQEIYDLKKSS